MSLARPPVWDTSRREDTDETKHKVTHCFRFVLMSTETGSETHRGEHGCWSGVMEDPVLVLKKHSRVKLKAKHKSSCVDFLHTIPLTKCLWPPLVSGDPPWSHFQPKPANANDTFSKKYRASQITTIIIYGTMQDSKMEIVSAIKWNQYVGQPGRSWSSSTESAPPPGALSHWESPTR